MKLTSKRKEFLSDLWMARFITGHLCGLCGNRGVIDTRGRATSPAGVDAGGLFYCICPNGLAIGGSLDAKPVESDYDAHNAKNNGLAQLVNDFIARQT